jgi:hypothetical protein
MSDPPPTPVFNLMYDVRSTDTGTGYAGGI